MADDSTESGLELVLDNRKLIIVFFILISVCGCFFVLGFIEGKRQGFREGTQSAADLEPKANLDGARLPSATPPAPEPVAKAASEAPEEQKLNWYKNVNRPADQVTEPKIEPKPAPKKTETEKPKPKESHTAPATYSVQVGAFRQAREVTAKAESLRAKGFDCRIEPPHPPEELYLLKVGKFESRADAVAMQLKLKKNGFTCFIKTN
jgi:cell division protein FtsN